jgi:hypothetical protein
MRFYTSTTDVLMYLDKLKRKKNNRGPTKPIEPKYRDGLFRRGVYKDPDKRILAFVVCSSRDQYRSENFWKNHGGYPTDEGVLQIGGLHFVTLQDNGILGWRLVRKSVLMYADSKNLTEELYLNDKPISALKS